MGKQQETPDSSTIIIINASSFMLFMPFFFSKEMNLVISLSSSHLRHLLLKLFNWNLLHVHVRRLYWWHRRIPLTRVPRHRERRVRNVYSSRCRMAAHSFGDACVRVAANLFSFCGTRRSVWRRSRVSNGMRSCQNDLSAFFCTLFSINFSRSVINDASAHGSVTMARTFHARARATQKMRW